MTRMGAIEKNAPLWKRTTFRIGGAADTLITPGSTEELARILRAEDVKLILGGGSNLLVSDAGIRGVVVNLRGGLDWITPLGDDGETARVNVGAGTQLVKLSGWAMKMSLTGLEFAFGIPGTVGGAVVMNAGAHGGEMKNVVETVTVITREGEVRTVTNGEAGFSYRASALPEGCVVISTVIRLAHGDREMINETMRRNQMKRKVSQPLDMPSAGSVYKNPPGDYAGRLIEAAGLKGHRIGGAMISRKHANFIVNTGGATASDVVTLMTVVEKEVCARFGVALEREIKLAGFER